MATTPDAAAAAVTHKRERYPAQVFYVLGTEAAERFSFYGLTTILTQYMVKSLGYSEAGATEQFGYFNMVVYLAPLVGGLLADQLVGRYKTILYVSLAYVAGHGVLSMFESRFGLYLGCFLIAMGAGGIKPCVSAFMGDQFRADQTHLLERAYGWFYFAINAGSVGGIFLVGWTYDAYGARIALLLPGIAMLVAWVIYVLGRNTYTKLPPVVATGVKATPEERRLGWTATFRIAFVFLFVSAFWALFFQYGSSWQLQADKMNLMILGFKANAGQISLYNSFFVLALIPVMNGIYKRAADRGREIKPLNKMMIGMYIAPLAFISAMLLQRYIDASPSAPPSALWQGVQYFFLSLAEVLISITGLEFAYTQAPKTARGLMMGVWFLCISLGGFMTAAVARGFTVAFGEPINWQNFYLFFFAVMLVAAIAFTFVARWYKPVNFEAAAARPPA